MGTRETQRVGLKVLITRPERQRLKMRAAAADRPLSALVREALRTLLAETVGSGSQSGERQR